MPLRCALVAPFVFVVLACPALEPPDAANELDGGSPTASTGDAGEPADGGASPDAGLPARDGGTPPEGPDGGTIEPSDDAGEPPAGGDAGAVDPLAECASDDDCAGARRCHQGSCRLPCLLGTCLHDPDDGVCAEGFCVECAEDEDCPGARYTCDLDEHRCQPQHVDTSGTRIGIFYSLWHCPFAADNPEGHAVHDISEVLAGHQPWGPLLMAHWWDEPAAGYYCLSRNDALLAQHATLLRDAGVEFIFFDATNHAYADWRSDRTRSMILDPLDRLLAVWSGIAGAPKVVPWVPVIAADTNANANTIDAIVARLDAHPDLAFEYLGKPLILVTENESFISNEAKLAELAQRFTIRRMWAHEPDGSQRWSFLEGCEADPALTDEPCRQRIAPHDGELEQVSITMAYQLTYMSVPEYAVPKHGGLTFRRQFQTLLDNPRVPIATITGWNEWIAQRMPCGQNPTCPCNLYPEGCFMDQYDVEYSRDIEPGDNARGDEYYRLLASCIAVFRSGDVCDASNADELCCQASAP